MLMLVSCLVLASCGDPCADGHVDADGDEICDNCEASVPKQPDDPNNPDQPELPEEPERDPTYKISFNYHGTIYSNLYTKDEEGNTILEYVNGLPAREGEEKDIEIYVLDVLQNQAPTEEQLLEIPDINYGGITIVGWYDSPSYENEVDFTQVLTADKKVYAKLKIEETDNKGNGYCGDEATWKVTSSGVLKIEGSGAMYDFTYPELAPWYFDETGARRRITGVDVGNKITHIGSYSFYNLSIAKAEEIELGKAVTSIGNYAFAYSTILKELPLTETISVIGRGAFEGCKEISRIIIPDSVVEIQGYAFYGCSKFETLILGTGVKTIGEYAFNQDTGTAHKYIYYRGTKAQYDEIIIQLGNVRFDPYGAYLYFYVEADSAEAKTAGQYWTYDSKGNPKFLSYTVRYMAPGLAKFPLLTDFILIGADGKTGVYTQENVDKMNAIVYRGYKFDNFNNAAYINLANPAKVSGHLTFTGVRGKVVGDNASYSIDTTTATLSITGSGATWDFEGIGDAQFYNDLITSVKFDSDITYLGSNLLAGISSLVFVEIPESVTEVDPKLFAGCLNLSAVYYLGSDLANCTGLDSLVDTNAKVYAKGSAASAGKEGAFWQDKADGTRLAWSFKDGVLTIGGGNEMPDFAKGEAPWSTYEDVKELNFAINIVKLGENAFSSMKKIDKITFHDKLVNIPRSAFEGSGYWKNDANWENGALMAGAHLLAFDSSKVTTAYATIPQATKVIIAEAFKGCGDIEQLVLPKVINFIDETAFDGLKGLKTIYFYGENINVWNALPEAGRNDISTSVKVLFRSGTKPAENPENYWRNVSRVPTTWDK